MTLSDTTHLIPALTRAKRPLILIPEGATTDVFAAALGCAIALRRLNTDPTILSLNATVPRSIGFLPNAADIKTKIEGFQVLHIEIPTDRIRLRELTQEQNEQTMRLTLVPEDGCWKPHELRVHLSSYPYDLIICLGAQDLSRCKKLFDAHSDFFYQTPIVNIDHAASNQHFGHWNAVDVTATCTSEVCRDLLHHHDPTLVDADAATAFLSGMMAATRSFKTPNVTPRTLETAGALLQSGARREEIVQHLFRTRPVSTLRLWGRALARLKYDSTIGLLWTLLSRQDFLQSGGTDEELPDVLDELLATSPDASRVLVLYENKQRQICALMRAEPPLDAASLLSKFGGIGSARQASACFPNSTLVEVERLITASLKA